MEKAELKKNEIKKFVEQDKLSEAINSLLTFIHEKNGFQKDDIDSAIIISSRFISLKRNNISGLLNFNDYNIEYNSIKYSILELLNLASNEKVSVENENTEVTISNNLERAEIFYYLNEFEDAINEAKKVIEKDPNNPRSTIILVGAYFKLYLKKERAIMGKYGKELIKQLESVSEKFPNDRLMFHYTSQLKNLRRIKMLYPINSILLIVHYIICSVLTLLFIMTVFIDDNFLNIPGYGYGFVLFVYIMMVIGLWSGVLYTWFNPFFYIQDYFFNKIKKAISLV